MDEEKQEMIHNRLRELFRTPLMRVICLAALIVLVLIAAASVLTGRGSRNKQGQTTDYFFPVQTDRVLDMQLYDDGLAVLQTNSVCYVDNGGNLIAQNQHKYSNPTLRTAGSYALLFDRGANTFRVEKKGAAGTDHTLNAGIVNADICSSGVYGYLLYADGGYQSHLFVYSSKHEKVFEWGSAADCPVLLKISPRGNGAAAVTFGAENAELYSMVHLFEFSKSKEIFSVKLSKSTVFAVKYISAHELCVFADTGVYRIRKDGVAEAVREYSASELNCASVSGAKLSALSLNLYGNERNAQILLFDRKFKKQTEILLDEKVTAVFSDDKRAAVVCGSTVRILDAHGGARVLSFDENCSRCLLRNHSVYALTSGGIVVKSFYDGDTPS